jgi:hypothetical protein
VENFKMEINNHILIGSSAIKHWFPDFNREPKDLDFAVRVETFGETHYQGFLVERLVNPILFDSMTIPSILSPDDLYTLKLSHLFWNINWDKHMYDVQFLQKKGCVLNTCLFYKLYEYWNSYHGENKRSDLDMTSSDFFDNALKCDYPHDDIHTLLENPPTYTKILIGEVNVCEEKFKNLTFDEKCALVYEEVMVMSWERYRHMDYRVAYTKMLKKFIMSHAPMWEALFIIENYITLHKPKFNYFKQIENGLHKIKQNSERFACS